MEQCLDPPPPKLMTNFGLIPLPKFLSVSLNCERDSPPYVTMNAPKFFNLSEVVDFAAASVS